LVGTTRTEGKIHFVLGHGPRVGWGVYRGEREVGLHKKWKTSRSRVIKRQTKGHLPNGVGWGKTYKW